jgi:hypothetical protein
LNELLDRLLSGKIKRPLAVVYSLFWCARHWQGLVSLFFENEKYIIKYYDVLKVDYLKNYFGYRCFEPVYSCHNLWFIIDAVVALFFGLAIIPGISKWHMKLYRLQQNFSVAEQKIKIEANKTILELKLEENKLKTYLNESKSEEDKWIEDFEKISGNDMKSFYETLIKIEKGNEEINSDSAVGLAMEGLVDSFENQEKMKEYQTTEKGKAFYRYAKNVLSDPENTS